jgi:hypothetical protein
VRVRPFLLAVHNPAWPPSASCSTPNIWLDWLLFEDTGIAHIRQLQEAGHVEILIDETCEAELAGVLTREFASGD